MVVFVNSQERELPAAATVQVLLETAGLLERRVAVEVNQALVTRQEWAAFKLKDGDRVEIVSFVGGG